MVARASMHDGAWSVISHRYRANAAHAKKRGSKSRALPATGRKSTRLNSSHLCASRMPTSACQHKTQHQHQVSITTDYDSTQLQSHHLLLHYTYSFNC